MKVGIVHQPFERISAPARGGALEIWGYQVARRLAQCYEVVVYSKRLDGQKQAEEHEGVRYYRLSTAFDDRIARIFVDRPRIKNLPGLRNPGKPLFASGFGNAEYGWRVARELRKQRCDIVHVMNYSDLVPPIRALNPNAKIILHMQCEWLNQLDRDMIRNRLKKVDLIIGCSRYITGKIQGAFPGVADRCRTVYNGTDTDAFVPNGHSGQGGSGAGKIVFVGRIAPEKGVHVLVEAFKKVVARHPQALLELIGAHVAPPPEFILQIDRDPQARNWGPLYGAGYLCYLKEIASGDVGPRVSFVGKLGRAALAERYKSAAVMVCPSVWNEPFGMVITEAMSAGVPVVATKGGGIPEIVEHGKSGLLAERGDARTLGDALIRLLGDENLRRTMGRAGRERVLHMFTWDKIAQDTLECYKELTTVGSTGRERAA